MHLKSPISRHADISGQLQEIIELSAELWVEISKVCSCKFFDSRYVLNFLPLGCQSCWDNDHKIDRQQLHGQKFCLHQVLHIYRGSDMLVTEREMCSGKILAGQTIAMFCQQHNKYDVRASPRVP